MIIWKTKNQFHDSKFFFEKARRCGKVLGKVHGKVSQLVSCYTFFSSGRKKKEIKVESNQIISSEDFLKNKERIVQLWNYTLKMCGLFIIRGIHVVIRNIDIIRVCSREKRKKRTSKTLLAPVFSKNEVKRRFVQSKIIIFPSVIKKTWKQFPESWIICLKHNLPPRGILHRHMPKETKLTHKPLWIVR